MNKIVLEITNGKTNLYTVINKFINDEWEKLCRNQIIPWSFLNTGKVFRCKYFSGKEIQYQLHSFEGSPREVFWGRYIEPFLEDISNRAIDQTIRFINEKYVSPKDALLETSKLLKILVRKTYDLMAEVDQRLRGRGYPQNVEKRKVDAEIAAMDKFIDDRVQSEIAMYRLPKFYYENKELIKFIAIAVGIIGGIVGIVYTIVKIFRG
jgi:hypothetical protein